MKFKTVFKSMIIFFLFVVLVNTLFAQKDYTLPDYSKFPNFVKGTVIVILKKGYSQDVLVSINHSIAVKTMKRTFVDYENDRMSKLEEVLGGIMWTVTFPVEKDVFEVIFLQR